MGKSTKATLLASLLLLIIPSTHTSTTAADLGGDFAFDILETNALATLRLQPGGYANESFEYSIDVLPGAKNRSLAIQTSFDRTLQYTLSTLEGRILTKGKVIREAELNVSNLHRGSYVMYFFRGHRVVKAVLLDRM